MVGHDMHHQEKSQKRRVRWERPIRYGNMPEVLDEEGAYTHHAGLGKAVRPGVSRRPKSPWVCRRVEEG